MASNVKSAYQFYGIFFYQIRDDVASLLGYDKPSHLMKNMHGASKVIGMIYEQGKSVQCLEELVLAINSMD